MSTGHDGSLPVPKNTNVYNLTVAVSKADLLLLFPAVFRKFFWEELYRIIFLYKLNLTLPVLKSLVIFLLRALKYKKAIGHILQTGSIRPQVIYSHWTFEFTMGACLLKKDYPLRIASHYHSLGVYFERHKENYIPFRSYIFNNCDLNLFISRHGHEYFLQRNKIFNSPPGKTAVMYLGVEEPPEVYEQSYDRIILLSNAWIQPLKRIDLIIRALKLIEAFSVEWIHIGDDYGSGLFRSICQLADKLLKAKPNIRYEFAGRKNFAGIRDVFIAKKVNLFINTSATEGVPISMMEALSFGVPLLGTSVGGVPEVIRDGYNGFLLPENPSPEEVAGKITHYFKLPVAAKAGMADNARKTWEEQFNGSKNYGQMAVLLKNLCIK